MAKGEVVCSTSLFISAVQSYLFPVSICETETVLGLGAHFWARMIGKFGHEVRLISPHFVKPYVKSNQNDANDAAAICVSGRAANDAIPPA
jgi:transposase